MYRLKTDRIPWDEEREEWLRRLYINEGLSCSQIAAQMGGLTRNAVIGKVHRLGLALRGHKHNKKAWSKTARIRSPGEYAHKLEKAVFGDRTGIDFNKGKAHTSVAEPFPPRHETDVARISFEDLIDGKHCKFIPDDPGGGTKVKKYCGLEVIAPGAVYCPAHDARCREPSRPRFTPRTFGGATFDRTAALKEFEESH